MSLLSFIVLFSVILVCQGRGKYRGFIPNGFNVPNPCTADPTDIWARVGHVNQDWKVDKKAGTYEKTAFGQVMSFPLLRWYRFFASGVFFEYWN